MSHPLSEIQNVSAAVSQAYASLGVTSLFPWQYSCLTTTSALQGRSLVYNAPTSGGKTLVSELIILSRFAQTSLKAVFVLPYISIVTEKVRCFDRVMRPAGVRVRAFCGSQGDSDFMRADLAVCTIEKANRLITKAIDEGKIGQVGLVVVDELHMLSDNPRGVILECLLTKLLYTGRIQIVGMSATLPNLDCIAHWLQADMFISEFRPVPLRQFAVIQGNVYSSHWEKVRTVPAGRGVGALVEEVKSCIVFCPTRFLCEKTASDLSKSMGDYPESQEIIKKLLDITGETVLLGCLRKGVSFHHSGLINEEKEVVEAGFLKGAVRVICATSTLAAGVNLPAQRVIITSPRLGKVALPICQYRQMCGRAGRTGFDASGDSYLFCDANGKEKALNLMTSALPPVQSALDSNGLKRVILDVVSTEICRSLESVRKCVSLTLYASSHSAQITSDTTEALKYLLDNRMLEEREDRLHPTLLGRAVLSSSLSPEEGLVVFMELERAASRLCLLSDLHIIYLSTPILSPIFPNWRQMLPLIVKEKDTPHFLSISQSIGISEDFICRCEMFTPDSLTMKELVRVRYDAIDTDDYKLIIHTRFYASLVLVSLNSSTEDTSAKFHLDRGTLQAFAHQSSTYLSLISAFVGRLNWWNYEGLFAALRERAAYIDQSDIQPLLSIEGVDVEKARILVGAGLHTIGRIARAPIPHLSKLFEKYCLPSASTLAVQVSNSSRKRFAAIFLTNKRKKVC